MWFVLFITQTNSTVTHWCCLLVLLVCLHPADQRRQDLQLLEAAPPDEGGGGGGRSLMPYAKDADDVDADADDDDSSSDEVNLVVHSFVKPGVSHLSGNRVPCATFGGWGWGGRSMLQSHRLVAFAGWSFWNLC